MDDVQSADDILIRSLADAPLMGSLPEVVGTGDIVPPNPPAEVQQKFVGREFEAAYLEALSFVRVAGQWSGAHGRGGLNDVPRILDFGSGWGRISRILLSQGARPSQLVLADVDRSMLALTQSSLPGLDSLTVDPLPPTVLGDATIGLVTAFSVFSHLAPVAHRAWAHEFGRVLVDGGLAVVTMCDESLFSTVAHAQAVDAGSTWAKIFATQLDAARETYQAGGIAYWATEPDGPRHGDFYGWAAASPAWVERAWGEAGFDVVQWVPSGVLFPQAAVALRRRPRVVEPGVGESARRLAGGLVRRARRLASQR